MKRIIVVLGVLAGLLLTSACGGLSKSEQKAADSLGNRFSSSQNGSKPTKTAKDAGKCLGKKFVEGASLKQLKKDKVVTSSNKAASQFPRKLSKKSANAYADAYVSCYDVKKFKKDIKKQSGATTKQVDAYADCIDAVSDKDMKKAIVSDYTQTKPSKTSTSVHKKLTGCYDKLKG